MNDNIEKKFYIVYFSSISNNTHRFILKVGCRSTRLPINFNEDPPIIEEPFILLTPTYAGGHGQTAGAVPKQVKKFLNIETNRNNCKAVIASGNTNFYDTYCLAGDIISKKLNIPYLYNFELLGTKQDVENVIEIGNKFWKDNNF
ncbi:MAG: class Ib ribonucleoside-diphosphate reductase assembly flavoprotein NrdI [Malacoplasma sp.]|nr:class Ib ribonucleoside-diphosphate reductase assembly flavoprotein NrdI [Malacoplasma sp.]MDE5952514.1 class Ib ribonucleoside-diphosphate reductase assembly flavoprotein NrdI [Malacoplasma sp.]MDE6893894.1 class Ib ribonucleoside-diphosphate reductase assembly flavoprotein NrdI [Malacoplasma sp.]MDE7075621.1 class Ib ribonucleoside-diphosphate reductase assembly flavoprotein NrdI [Malacoplasma sp.]MDE7088395.1 class Ib ribonucleoside-diphosphate reductase assembly flavoprotein NrdI [Malaco